MSASKLPPRNVPEHLPISRVGRMFEKRADIRAVQRAKVCKLARQDRSPYTPEVERFLAGKSDKRQHRLWLRITETADEIWFFIRAFFAR